LFDPRSGARLIAEVVELAEARSAAEAERVKKLEASWVEGQGSSDGNDSDNDDDDGGNLSVGGEDDDVSILSGAVSPDHSHHSSGSGGGGSSSHHKRRKSRRRRRRRRGGSQSPEPPAEEKVITLAQMRAGVEGRLENELERRARLASEAKFALFNKERILEQREAQEIDRLLMIQEDKRSRGVIKTAKEAFYHAVRAEATQSANEVSALASALGEKQRRGHTHHDEVVKARYSAFKAEAAAATAAARVEAKKRAAAEALRLADIRAAKMQAAAEEEAAAAAEAAAAQAKAARKAAALKLEVDIKRWRKELDLHERTGVAWNAKTKAVERVHNPAAGGFKLVGGELRWRDSDVEHGWLAPGDPRRFKEDHPLLKSLLTLGKVKPWTWSERMRPAPPEGMPDPTTTTASEADDEGNSEKAGLLTDGNIAGEEEEKNGNDFPLALGQQGSSKQQQWAQNQAY